MGRGLGMKRNMSPPQAFLSFFRNIHVAKDPLECRLSFPSQFGLRFLIFNVSDLASQLWVCLLEAIFHALVHLHGLCREHLLGTKYKEISIEI